MRHLSELVSDLRMVMILTDRALNSLLSEVNRDSGMNGCGGASMAEGVGLIGSP